MSMERPSESLLAAVEAQTGQRLAVVRPLPGGWNSGTTLVTAGDTSLVLKTHGQRSFDELSAIHEFASAAGAAGWPTPEWFGLGQLPDGVPWSLQEYCEGEGLAVLDEPSAVAVLAANSLQKGLAEWFAEGLPLRDRSAVASGMLLNDEWGHLAAVRGFSPAAGSLVDELLERTEPWDDLPGGDLVHGDYNQANILLANGAVRAFVDPDELGVGTRAFDLVDLYHRSLLDGDPPAGRAMLHVAVLELIGESGFARCFATTALGTMKWMIERLPERVPDRVDLLRAELAKSR